MIDKLIPRQARFKKTVTLLKKRYACGEKVLFNIYKNNMTFWEVGTVKQRVWELVYIIQGPNNIHKRHLNQLRKCRVNDLNVSPPQICEEPTDIIFENFDLDALQASPEVRRSNRKRKFTDPLSVDPKRRKYYTAFFYSTEKNLLERGWVVMGPLPTHWWTLLNSILIESQVLSSVGRVRLDRDWIFDRHVSLAYTTTFLCILLL